MRLSVASSALAAVVVLAPLAAVFAPAQAQDFSITNQPEPANPGHRDLVRELQAWWDTHAYYPRHAADNNDSGTVRLHLAIRPDGKVWTIDMVKSSRSDSLDAAAAAVFRGATVQPFPAGEPNAEINLTLHYVLTHRDDQPAAASYTSGSPRGPFTITNEPVKSPILDTMLQRVCTGTITLGGVPDHPLYGMHSWAQAIFFRKPDGTPWVEFYERGAPSLSPVTQIGKMLTWTGREEHLGRNGDAWHQYTVWPDGENHLSGAIGGRGINAFGIPYNTNLAGNSVDLTCATQPLPTVTWNDWLAQSTVIAPLELESVDPP
jgi:TonB family protein